MMPRATSSQRVMPPKMLIRTALSFRVRQDDAQRRRHLVGLGAAANIEEIGRAAAKQLDDVHGAHGQPGAVHHAADLAVQLDVRQAVFARLGFLARFFVQVAHFGQVGVPVQRVVVQHNLAVQGHQALVAGDHQGVNFGQGGVGAQ